MDKCNKLFSLNMPYSINLIGYLRNGAYIIFIYFKNSAVDLVSLGRRLPWALN